MNIHDPQNSTLPPAAEGVQTRLSPFSVAETLEHFKTLFRSRNLTLFAHIDQSAEARRVGLEMPETHLLLFGNPKGGTPLMVASPLLALDLPLKVLIWQSGDGRVWVSSTSVDYLRTRYAIPSELVGNIAIIDTLIEQALQG